MSCDLNYTVLGSLCICCSLSFMVAISCWCNSRVNLQKKCNQIWTSSFQKKIMSSYISCPVSCVAEHQDLRGLATLDPVPERCVN